MQLRRMMMQTERSGQHIQQVDLELSQTLGKLIPPKHRAALQAHPSYKAALEQGLGPLEEAADD